jgi:NTE family protein
MRKKIGLVLTGGGARAAYQVGVLQGIAEIIARDPTDPVPFDILAGTSAGAINSTFLAARVQQFTAGVQALRDFWQGLRAEQVIRTDFRALSGLGLRWLRDLSLGGLVGKSSSTYLLDATPLRSFLADKIDFAGIKNHLQSGRLHAIAISATNYLTGTTVVFYDGAPNVDPWVRSTRLSERADLDLRHVLASAAIPVFFEPVRLNGSFYGDGCVRLTTPLSPAIHLGADKVLAIGIRYRRPDEENRELNRTGEMDEISLIDIAGVMLNAAFLDALDTDIERMQRINRTVALLSKLQGKRHPELREIPLLAIRPSQDLGTLAAEQFDRFSTMLRYLLKGIGASSAKGWDLLSYLAFDEAYTGRLIELGYADALAQRDAINEFFAA